MNKDLRELIAGAAAERDVDILILAESGTHDQAIVAALKIATGSQYTALSDVFDKVRLFTRLPVSGMDKAANGCTQRSNGYLECISWPTSRNLTGHGALCEQEQRVARRTGAARR